MKRHSTPQRFFDTIRDPLLSDEDTALFVKKKLVNAGKAEQVIETLFLARKMTALRSFMSDNLNLNAEPKNFWGEDVTQKLSFVFCALARDDDRQAFSGLVREFLTDKKSPDLFDVFLAKCAVKLSFLIRSNHLECDASNPAKIQDIKEKSLVDGLSVARIFGEKTGAWSESQFEAITLAGACLSDFGQSETFLATFKKGGDRVLRKNICWLSEEFLEMFFLHSSDQDKKKIIRAAEMNNLTTPPLFASYFSKKALHEATLWAPSGAQTKKRAM